MKDQNTDITQISASIGLIEAAMTRVTNITAGLSGVIDIAASSFEQLNAQVTQFAQSMSGIAEQPGFDGILGQLTQLNVANEQALTQLATVNGAVVQLQTSVDAINTSINKSSEGTLGFVKSLADKVDMFTKLGPLYKGITAAIDLLSTADKRHLVLVQASLVYLKLKKIAVAALNLVMNQNPISKIVAALGLLVGALKLAGVDFTRLGEKISKCWATIKSWFGAADEASTAQEQLASATGELGEANQSWADSLAEVASNTQSLAQVQQGVASSEVNNIASQIAEQEKLLKLKQEVNAKIPEKLESALSSQMPMADNAKGVTSKTVELSKLPQMTESINAAKKEIAGLDSCIWDSNSVIGKWAENAGQNITKLSSIFKEFGGLIKDQSKSSFQKMTGGIDAVGAAMQNMGTMVGGATGSWMAWGANVLGAISAAIPALMSLIGVTAASTVATEADTTANVTNAGSKALAANAGLGPWGWVLGIAAVAGIVAAMASIPKFANGGIAYGPTLGLMGEYAGAANNPEVIAPLSKLKSLIQPAGMGGGEVVFRIKGSDLEGIYNKRAHINRRTR